MIEIWKDIPGYDGVYQASTLSRIRSINRVILGGCRIKGKKAEKTIKGQILTPVLADRYLVVRINHTNRTVHRLIALTFIPNPQRLAHVNHINGEKTDNRIENLEWLSARDNVLHARKLGLRKPSVMSELGRQTLRDKKNKQVLDIRTGEVYPSMMKAAEAKKVSMANLSTKLNGLIKNDLGLEFYKPARYAK